MFEHPAARAIAEGVNHFWTFDNSSEILHVIGGQFSIKKAPNNNGIILDENAKMFLYNNMAGSSFCLVTPCTSFTLALWVKLFGFSSRHILKAGDDATKNTGVFMLVNESKPDYLKIQVSNTTDTCKAMIISHKKVWTHVVVKWNDIDKLKIFKNGKIVNDDIACKVKDNELSLNREIELSGNAGFDDLLLWNTEISDDKVYRLYSFYRGRQNVF